MSISSLATKAARAAARLRCELGFGPTEAICPFDVAEMLSIPVRLVPLPSLEGMYSPSPKPTIIVSVERPMGRRRYTCGHELGHHAFGHGTRLDELSDEDRETWSPEEFLAHRFAAALLMPKLAVESAFARRGWSIGTPTPDTIFVVARELGVGFSTLVGYLERTLGAIPPAMAVSLTRTQLAKIRRRLAGFEVMHDITVVDRHWQCRWIDVEVGDVVMHPPDATFEGRCAIAVDDGSLPHLVATAPGTGTLSVDPLRSAVLLRVSRQGFAGLARYRHLEEVADDE